MLDDINAKIIELTKLINSAIDLNSRLYKSVTDQTTTLAVLENEFKNLKQTINDKLEDIKERVQKMESKDLKIIDSVNNDILNAIKNNMAEDKKGKWNVSTALITGLCAVIAALLMYLGGKTFYVH